MIYWTPVQLLVLRHHYIPWITTTSTTTATTFLLFLSTTTTGCCNSRTSASSISTISTTAFRRRTAVISTTSTTTSPSSNIQTVSMMSSSTTTNSTMSQSPPDATTSTTNDNHHYPKVNLLDLAASCVACAEAASRVITAIAEPSEEEEEEEDETNTNDNNNNDDTNATNHPPSLMKKKNTRYKEDGSFVTDADFAAQGIIVQAIRAISPHVRIVGEESAEEMAIHSQKYHDYYPPHHQNEIYQRAQQELRYRYYRQNVQPMPLAQGISIPHHNAVPVAENDQEKQNEEEEVDLTKTDRSVPSDSQQQVSCVVGRDFDNDPDDCYVDASRVGVVVDPLDGTKSYAQGDYDAVSVLICIIVDHEPYFGVIGKPFGYPVAANLTSVLDRSCVIVYGGPLIHGVYIAGGREIVASPLLTSTTTTTTNGSHNDLPRAVISSSRSIGEVQDFCAHLAAQELIHEEPILISGAGEKSLRLILQVNNEALWFFPKKGTSLWDVAAPDAILRSLGGKLTDKFGHSMDYSKAREDAENMEGVVACIDAKLHAKCIELYRQGDWANRGYQ